MGTRYYGIINGAAGGGRCRAKADMALSRLRDAGIDLSVDITQRPGHATELAREAYAAGHRSFLSFGGDGTSYEILNGLFPRPNGDSEAVTLGLVPLGTGNSFLRDFGITCEEAALDALTRGETQSCDIIRVEHDGGTLHYMNILSLGFTADVTDLANRRFKRLGAGGYVVSVLTNLATLSYPVIPYRLDDEEEIDRRPAAFLTFSNSRYTGGAMMMAPGAHATSGTIDMVRANPLPRRKLLAAFPRIFQGTHIDLPEVEERQIKKVEFIDAYPLPVMIDGEVMKLTLRSLSVVPGALKVVA